MVRNMWVTNGAVFLGILIASGIFDTSETLVTFFGITFLQYLLYASLLLFSVNLVYGLLLLRRGLLKPSNQVLLSGTICSFVGIIIASIVPPML